MKIQHLTDIAAINFADLRPHVLYWSTFTDPDGEVISFTFWTNSRHARLRRGQFGLRGNWNFTNNKDAISVWGPRDVFAKKMKDQLRSMMSPGALVRNLGIMEQNGIA